MKSFNISEPVSSSRRWPNAWLMPEEDVKDLKELNRMATNVSVSREDLSDLGISHCEVSNAGDFCCPVRDVPWDSDGVIEDFGMTTICRDHSYANIITLRPEHFAEHGTEDQFIFQGPSHKDLCYLLFGSGFLDVRHSGRWIRIQVQKGDLLTLPEKMYHRFTSIDTIDEIKYFAGQSICTPLIRIVVEREEPNKQSSTRAKGTNTRSSTAVY